jgi:hypothetical protein
MTIPHGATLSNGRRVFLKAARDGGGWPVASPYIRIHQRWYADATLPWLAKRRGWS